MSIHLPSIVLICVLFHSMAFADSDLSTVAAAANPVTYTVVPPSLKNFRTGQNRTLHFVINKLVNNGPLSIEIFCSQQGLCEFSDFLDFFTTDNSTEFLVNVKALGLGITELNIIVDGWGLEPYPLRLLRSSWNNKVANAFTVVISVFIIGVTFLMGTQLEWARIAAILKHPIGPATGAFCQFVLMPTVGFLIAKFLIPEDNLVAKLALFAASTCPGGGKSSFWTIIFGGNLDLSVSMTFTQTIAALFMMPLWMSTVGKHFTFNNITIPFFAIVEGLLVLLIPSGLGMLFIAYKRHLVEKLERWIKVVTWIATVVFTCFGVYANFHIIQLFTWRIAFCGMCLPWSGYIIAYFTALIFGQKWRERITIAIETGVQNVGIAAILLMWCLPEPEVDMAMVVPIVIMISTDKPLIILFLLLKCKAKICGVSEDEDDDSIQPKGDVYPESGTNKQVGTNVLQIPIDMGDDAKRKYQSGAIKAVL